MSEQEILIDRPSSRLRREIRDGQGVYFKEYSPSKDGRTPEVIRARTAREADLLLRLTASCQFTRRLGVPRIVAADPALALIATAEIPGQTLETILVGPYRTRIARDTSRALWLAGRWLKTFETTEVRDSDLENISPHEPTDLVEYCEVRLRNIQSAGIRWLNSRKILEVERRLGEWLDSVSLNDRTTRWCHGDFAPVNILWDGQKLTAIDFAMARVDLPFVDATYFLHRLEMLAIYFPWRRWPLAAWKRAFLAGFGRPSVELSPLWRAQRVRHLLCRLQTYARRPTSSLKQTCHRAWILRRLWEQLEKALAEPSNLDVRISRETWTAPNV